MPTAVEPDKSRSGLEPDGGEGGEEADDGDVGFGVAGEEVR